MTKTMMVLVAGPYRSGTGDDPAKMAANLAVLEQTALEIYERGHLPVIGEWLAMPLLHRAGSQKPGDAIWDRYSYPTADRLLEFCGAVVRLPGASQGADGDVKIARIRGIPVYTRVSDLPAGSPQPGRAELDA